MTRIPSHVNPALSRPIMYRHLILLKSFTPTLDEIEPGARPTKVYETSGI